MWAKLRIITKNKNKCFTQVPHKLDIKFFLARFSINIILDRVSYCELSGHRKWRKCEVFLSFYYLSGLDLLSNELFCAVPKCSTRAISPLLISLNEPWWSDTCLTSQVLFRNLALVTNSFANDSYSILGPPPNKHRHKLHTIEKWRNVASSQ